MNPLYIFCDVDELKTVMRKHLSVDVLKYDIKETKPGFVDAECLFRIIGPASLERQKQIRFNIEYFGLKSMVIERDQQELLETDDFMDTVGTELDELEVNQDTGDRLLKMSIHYERLSDYKVIKTSTVVEDEEGMIFDPKLIYKESAGKHCRQFVYQVEVHCDTEQEAKQRTEEALTKSMDKSQELMRSIAGVDEDARFFHFEGGVYFRGYRKFVRVHEKYFYND